MVSIIFIDLIRVITAFCFLGFAALKDFKTREVSNKVWIMFAPIALILTTVNVMLTNNMSVLWLMLFSFAVTSVLAVITFYLGLFGGADAKALICLSIAVPVYPKIFQPLLSVASPFFPISVLFYAAMLASLTAVFILVSNIAWKLKSGREFFNGFEGESVLKKMLVLFTAKKLKIESLEKNPTYQLVERIIELSDGKIKRRLAPFVKASDQQADFGKIKHLIANGALPNELWATPALPMLVYITVGFLTALFLGDFLFWLAINLS
ncbi:prepilin peptidase [Candidatus Bathyarchaeota archaeon]|nr:prepilin peptidase [Candidatus Bathyarchaeota archaeon]